MKSINKPRGFVALHRGDIADDLQAQYPDAFLLLCQIAKRARIKPDPINGLETGQAWIGDWKKAGIKTERRYRTAKKNLEKFKLATFKATSKGTTATLADTSVFSLSIPRSDEQNDGRVTSRRRASDEQVTTKNNVTKEQRDNDTLPPTPQGEIEPASEQLASPDTDVLKARINSLRPTWAKPARWSHTEEHGLFGGVAAQMAELDGNDWEVLKQFLNAHTDKGAGFWQPRNRSKFVETFADVWQSAERWKSKTKGLSTTTNSKLF